MSETTPRGGTSADEATQQLRVTPPMPRPLDPAAPSGRSAPSADSTEVLSIHDLLDGPPEPVEEEPPALTPLPPTDSTPALTPLPPEPAPAAAEPAAPAAPPAAAVPAPAGGPPARAVTTDVGRRLRSDAAAAWAGTRRAVEEWLSRGDNALVVATIAVALLLISVVALVS